MNRRAVWFPKLYTDHLGANPFCVICDQRDIGIRLSNGDRALLIGGIRWDIDCDISVADDNARRSLSCTKQNLNGWNKAVILAPRVQENRAHQTQHKNSNKHGQIKQT